MPIGISDHPKLVHRDGGLKVADGIAHAMPPLSDVEAVFWDIGGVILDVETIQRAHRRFVTDLVAEHARETTPERALETWRQTVGDYFRERDGTAFRPAREAYARAVEAIVGHPLARDTWEPDFRAAVDASIEPIPDAPAVIARLARSDGIPHQGIVSDVDAAEGRRILEVFDVRRHFDAVTTSEDVGRTKPDPAMFEAALSAAGVAPEQAVMIGDRYEHDMAGAKALGIRTVAHGADDGPAVDHHINALPELLTLLGLEDDGT